MNRIAPLLAPFLAAVALHLPQGLTADFTSEANARIEELRKRNARITLRDEDGEPIVGATMRIRMQRHTFPFGCSFCEIRLDNENYRRTFVENFNWATPDEFAKWDLCEPRQGVLQYDVLDRVVDFCTDNGIKLRGHSIFWEDPYYNADWTRGLYGEQMLQAVNNRLDSVVPRYRGRFLHWDVNNEILTSDFIEPRLGSWVLPWMFKRAKELDPQCQLFTNEYGLLDSGWKIDEQIELVRWLQSEGAPVDGIGAQAHFYANAIDGEEIYYRIERLAVLHLPIWVTELDVSDPDENRRAAKLEEFLRSAYSHRNVQGIILWGHWAGCIWRGPDAALWNLDWSINAAGRRWRSLVFGEWWTNVDAVTDSNGTISFRGFHGEYRLEVDLPGGPQRTRLFTLGNDSPQELQLGYTFSPDTNGGADGFLLR